MKNIGIWIDKKIAKIVSIENGIEHLEMFNSEVEDFHIGGGSGTKMNYLDPRVRGIKITLTEICISLYNHFPLLVLARIS